MKQIYAFPDNAVIFDHERILQHCSLGKFVESHPRIESVTMLRIMPRNVKRILHLTS